MRITFELLLVSAAVAACNGWPRAPKLEEVTSKAEKYPTYAATPAEPAALAFAGRHWVVAPPAFELRGARLQQVGTIGNVALFAKPGANAPYPELFTPAGGTKWRRVVPID